MLRGLFYQLVLALAPVSENRGALLYGFMTNQNLFHNFLISTIPILLLLPFLIWFWDKTNIAPFIHNFMENRSKKAVKRIEKLANKYGYLAMLIFVSIPLPVTGVYTASFVARVLQMDKRKSSFFMALGAVISSLVIITLKEIFNITIRASLL